MLYDMGDEMSIDGFLSSNASFARSYSRCLQNPPTLLSMYLTSMSSDSYLKGMTGLSQTTKVSPGPVW